MDPQHRHDIEQNDLEEFLIHFREWWNKWGNTLLTTVLVVLLVVVVWRFIENRQASLREQSLAGLLSETSPEGLRDFGLGVSDPAVRARAFLRAADMLLARAATSASEGAGERSNGNAQQGADASPTAATSGKSESYRRSDLAEARALYERVASEQRVHEALRLNAQLGIAATVEGSLGLEPAEKAEALRREAREVYQKVIDAADKRYPALAGAARHRQSLLDTLGTPLAFAPDAPPAAPTPGSVASPDQPAAPDAPPSNADRIAPSPTPAPGGPATVPPSP